MHFEPHVRWYADGAVNLLIEVWDSNASENYLYIMTEYIAVHDGNYW